MSSGIQIRLQGLEQVKKEIRNVPKNAAKQIEAQLRGFGEDVVREAKTLAPVDEGHLKSSISYKLTGANSMWTVEIVVATDYAAYLEFGTRKYAQRYVSTLPKDWQTYAATFKGKSGSGSMEQMVDRIMAWVKRKGFAAERTRGGNASRSKRSVDKQENVAYIIALRILQNGIRAHPFLFPAVRDNKPLLIKALNNLFK